MSAEKIVADLKKKKFAAVYWLEGEEDFFIDEVIHFAEREILSEAEAGFNLTVFYGRDASWQDIINACRRYPMFAERQVVIVKEAQFLKDIEKLEAYVERPLNSTLFFVAYKGKKLDGRTKLAKMLKDKSVLLSTRKMYESALPDWVNERAALKGYSITRKANALLIDHIGNDLSRLVNEIDKLAVNLKDKTSITEDDIEKYIGISKEYNVFELQQAVAHRDLYKAIRIINYFDANPKVAPMQLILPAMYGFFSKVRIVYSAKSKDEATIASLLGTRAFIRDFVSTTTRFSSDEIDKILLLLYEYNLRNIGVNDSGTSPASLLKEMVVKMIQPL